MKANEIRLDKHGETCYFICGDSLLEKPTGTPPADGGAIPTSSLHSYLYKAQKVGNVLRKLVNDALNSIFICGARQLTGETHSVKSSKAMFSIVKKTISVVILASDGDYGFIGLPIELFSESREICLMLHENSVLSAEENKMEGLDKIVRYSGPQNFANAVQKAAQYAKDNHPKDTLSIIIDADVGRTGQDYSVKRPSMALIRSDGSIPGKLVFNSNFNGRGRKILYKTDKNSQTQISLQPSELSVVLLACANIGIRLGFGMMALPNKNNWEDYAKGNRTAFQQGLNGGGVRVFLHPKAFDAYSGLNVLENEEDYKTNVFLAESFGGRTAFVPRFVSISYVVLWGSKSITRSKVSHEYRRYLLREVIEPLNELGLKSIIVGGKGEKSASIPRLIRTSSKLNESTSQAYRFSASKIDNN